MEMGFEEKTPDLLALLTAHVGGMSLAVVVTPCPPTPVAVHTSPVEAIDKKRKRGRGGKGPEGVEEGEIVEPPAKEACAGKGQ